MILNQEPDSHHSFLFERRSASFFSDRIIAVMSRRGGLAAGKAMMKMAGLDCGPVRAPLANFPVETIEVFTRELEHAGFPLETNAGLRTPTPARASAQKASAV